MRLRHRDGDCKSAKYFKNNPTATHQDKQIVTTLSLSQYEDNKEPTQNDTATKIEKINPSDKEKDLVITLTNPTNILTLTDNNNTLIKDNNITTADPANNIVITTGDNNDENNTHGIIYISDPIPTINPPPIRYMSGPIIKLADVCKPIIKYISNPIQDYISDPIQYSSGPLLLSNLDNNNIINTPITTTTHTEITQSDRIIITSSYSIEGTFNNNNNNNNQNHNNINNKKLLNPAFKKKPSPLKKMHSRSFGIFAKYKPRDIAMSLKSSIDEPIKFFQHIPTVLVEDCRNKLIKGFHKSYGYSNAKYLEIIYWVCENFLHLYSTSDCLYHDIHRACCIALIGQDLIHGKHVMEGLVSTEDWLHFIIALICHDIGYVGGSIISCC